MPSLEERARIEWVAEHLVGTNSFSELRDGIAYGEKGLLVGGSLGVVPAMAASDGDEKPVGKATFQPLFYLYNWDGTPAAPAPLSLKENFRLTSMARGQDGAVYAAGYASMPVDWAQQDAKAEWQPEPDPIDAEAALFTPDEHFTHPLVDGRLDTRGRPVVVRYDADLKGSRTVLLEGWQSLWHVPKPLDEDWIQPVLLASCADGDLVVAHDGGYNRITNGSVMGGLEGFYSAGDYLSRLSGDLSQRRWVKTVGMAPIDPVVAGECLRIPKSEEKQSHRRTVWELPEGTPWPYPYLGNTHTLSMTMGGEDAIYLSGFSSSRTGDEPWWAPFAIRLSATTGEELARAYTPDPMSGADRRMNGRVSDSVVGCVRMGSRNNLLAACWADGGNSVIRFNPLDPLSPQGEAIQGNVWGFGARLLFWGTAVSLDAETMAFQSGTYVHGWNQERKKMAPGWVTDLVQMEDGTIVAVGRTGPHFQYSKNAWSLNTDSMGGFLRLYDEQWNLIYSTGFKTAGAVPHRIVTNGEELVVLGWRKDNGQTTGWISFIKLLGDSKN